MRYNRELKLAISEIRLDAYKVAAGMNEMSLSAWIRKTIFYHLITAQTENKLYLSGVYKKPINVYANVFDKTSKREILVSARVTEEFMDSVEIAARESLIPKGLFCVLVLDRASGISKLSDYL